MHDGAPKSKAYHSKGNQDEELRAYELSKRMGLIECDNKKNIHGRRTQGRRIHYDAAPGIRIPFGGAAKRKDSARWGHKRDEFLSAVQPK